MAYDFTNYSKVSQPKEVPADANDKHMAMLEAIAPYAKNTEQKNVTDIIINNVSRSTKLVLVQLPQWSAYFPPFNLARLSAVAKQAGYDTRILDINAKCYKEYKYVLQHTADLDYTMWDPAQNWRWTGENYYKFIHPFFEDMFNSYIKDIVSYNPQAIGFTQYQFSEEPTKWMIQELKKKLPNIKILVGGSNVQHEYFRIQPYYDYVVNGEGEEAILKILEEIENGVSHRKPQFISQPFEQRINLNNMPLPDYSSIDFNDYEIPNGINTELSRGCIAKCTFCEETHFWKYRQRKAVDALSEIEWLYYNKGTDIIWFIDSLVNGNLNELRAFAKGVIAKGLDIKWTGYARCDGRMDSEYFKDLAASGCMALNYGTETGSQKVLDDLDKKVTVEEMEQNFRDGSAVGIKNATNWIVGFPTETYNDFADTMTFLWRNRNMNINNIGTGMGFGLGPETIAGQNPKRFNLSDFKYCDFWITDDFRLGGTHVHTRVKTFNIFVDSLVTKEPFSYPVRPNLKKYHYDLRFIDDNIQHEIDYEDFDYNLLKTNINPYADGLVNEVWPLLRTLWRARGGYNIKILFDPSIDVNEFDQYFGTGQYLAEYVFYIDHDGNWKADFQIDYKQNFVEAEYKTPERQGPFYLQDYSRMTGNAALRARKLAKPDWGMDARSGDQIQELINEEFYLNQTVEWSFNFNWSDSGKWLR